VGEGIWGKVVKEPLPIRKKPTNPGWRNILNGEGDPPPSKISLSEGSNLFVSEQRSGEGKQVNKNRGGRRARSGKYLVIGN